MSAHPLEAKLRPLYEGWVAATAMAAALASSQLPGQSAAMLAVDVGLFSALALYQLARAWPLYRYQRGLRVLAPYRLRESAIPLDAETRLLGRGFCWGAAHTQRLLDTRSTAGQRFLRPRFWEPDLSGDTAIHGVGEGEAPFVVPQGAREGHTLVYGTNGAGKTTLERLLVAQDIAAEGATFIFDPKNSPALKQTAAAAALAEGKPFYLFDLADPEASTAYNPLAEYDRVTELAGRLTTGVPNQGDSSAFREYAWLFSNIDAQALIAMGEPVTLDAIRHYLPRPDALLVALWDRIEGSTRRPPRAKELGYRGWDETAARIAHHLQTHPSEPLLHTVADLLRWSAEHYQKLANSLLPQLDKLITGPVGQLFLPPEEGRRSFSWQQALDEQAVVYVSLVSLADPDVATTIARMMFADLASLAGRLLAERRHANAFLHLDELSDLLGEVFIAMANKTREAGFCLTGYTQTHADIVHKMGGRAAAERVTGNFNSLILLRVRDPSTANVLIEQLPEVEITTTTAVNLAVDSSDPESGVDYTSHAGDRLHTERVPMLSPAEFANLPDGHGFALIRGEPLKKFRFPLLEAA